MKSRREPLFFRSLGARVLLASGLLLTLVTCRDGTGPEGLHYARVAVAPVFSSEAGLAAFGLAIDRVRFVVVRPIAPPDTVADTTVALPPDARVLDLSLRVPIVTSPETVLVSIVALAGAVPRVADIQPGDLEWEPAEMGTGLRWVVPLEPSPQRHRVLVPLIRGGTREMVVPPPDYPTSFR